MRPQILLKRHKEKGLIFALQKMRNLQRPAQGAAEVVHDDLWLGEREGIV
jgi:hypothetical protein